MRFGGDCEGIRDVNQGIRSFCLHVRQDFASSSEEVAPGVYLTSFGEAQELVDQGWRGGNGVERSVLQAELVEKDVFGSSKTICKVIRHMKNQLKGS